jgi:phosphoribosylformylglycinamidine synthase PurS subunit
MKRYRVAVHVLPRDGILDPQGHAVADALHTLGFNGVQDVRIGRHIVVDTDADTPEAATEAVRAMCGRLLANPVIEDFEIASVTRS